MPLKNYPGFVDHIRHNMPGLNGRVSKPQLRVLNEALEIGYRERGIVPAAPVAGEPPWMIVIAGAMGLHERRDRAKLIRFLKRDGSTVGDPARIPWCADLIETAIKVSLPNEPFPGRVGANAYLAMNWLDFGIELEEPAYGCLGVFHNGNPRSMFGHIGTLVGIDPVRGNYRVRGGNQSNAVNDTWLSAKRVRDHGYRWPSTYRGPRRPLPRMDSRGAVISTSER